MSKGLKRCNFRLRHTLRYSVSLVCTTFFFFIFLEQILKRLGLTKNPLYHELSKGTFKAILWVIWIVLEKLVGSHQDSLFGIFPNCMKVKVHVPRSKIKSKKSSHKVLFDYCSKFFPWKVSVYIEKVKKQDFPLYFQILRRKVFLVFHAS